jgi:hypothetical protein
MPFAFKPYCFMEVRKRGFESVLWLDSSCIVLGPLDPVFEQIEADGYVVFRNGSYWVGEWASDVALSELEITRDEAMALPEVNAAAIGLSMRDPVAVRFLERWFAVARDGVAFRGVREELADKDDYQALKWNRDGRASRDPRVRGHRNDQTVAGVLAHELGLRLSETGLATRGPDEHLAKRPVIVVDRNPASSRSGGLRELSRLGRRRAQRS